MKFIMTTEVSRRLELSVDTVRKFEREGKLTAIKVGRGTRLFDPRDVERLRVERQAKKGPAGWNRWGEGKLW